MPLEHYDMLDKLEACFYSDKFETNREYKGNGNYDHMINTRVCQMEENSNSTLVDSMREVRRMRGMVQQFV